MRDRIGSECLEAGCVFETCKCLKACQERNWGFRNTVDYRRDRLCSAEIDDYSKSQKEYSDVSKDLAGKMGKDDNVFPEIMQRRAEAEVPKIPGKGWLGSYVPRLGKQIVIAEGHVARFIRDTPYTKGLNRWGWFDIAENPTKFSKGAQLSVASFLSNLISPGGIVLRLEGH